MRKPIAGFEGYYEISNEGEVWSYHAKGSARKRVFGSQTVADPVRLTPAQSGRTGRHYLAITLCRPSKRRRALIHVLVAEHFLGPRPPGYQVNHKNANKLDNRLENLEWVTPAENIQHAINLGLMPPPWKGKKFSAQHLANLSKCTTGENNPRAKLTEAEVLKIRALAGQVTQKQLAARYGVAASLISLIVTRRCWKHI